MNVIWRKSGGGVCLPGLIIDRTVPFLLWQRLYQVVPHVFVAPAVIASAFNSGRYYSVEQACQ